MSGPLLAIDVVRPEHLSDRDHRRFLNTALRGAATVHMLTKDPKHYRRGKETAVGGDYDYEPRGRKYMIRKARLMAHQDPNVFSGAERAYVLSNSRVTATATRGARIIRRALHSRNAEQADRWVRELSAISDDESREATERAAAEYHKQVEHHQKTKVVRQRGSDGRFL